MEKYTAFFTSRPFWSQDKPDFGDIGNKNYQVDKFREIMSEEVFVHSTEEYVLKFCRDGAIMLRVHEIEKQVLKPDSGLDIIKCLKLWSRYLDYLNSIYLLLDATTLEKMKISYFEISEITNQDAFRVSFKEGKFTGESISDTSYMSKFQMGRWLGRYPQSDLENLAFSPLIEERRIEISNEVFDKIVADLDLLFKYPEYVRIFATVTKSLGEYKIGNFSTSLVLAWFVIELFLYEYWGKFLKETNKNYSESVSRINSKRFKNLKEGRDYTAAVISNMLELVGKIDLSLFEKIDEVRGYRNKIVHNDKKFECKDSHCINAFYVIKNFIKKGSNIDLDLNLTYSIRGI